MPNIVNQMVVRELQDEFKDAEGMVLVAFGGLTVEETSDIRGKLAEKNVRFKMVRNSLAKRVLADRDITFDGDAALKGNTGIAYGDAEAAIDAAKVFADKDVKKSGKVIVKGAVLEGNCLDAASATALADLPDRDSLHAMLLGVISGPARGLATVINAVPASVARVIQAHADDAEDGDEG
ncbi:50S ribosomal protein L10 [Planctomycetota bacterium]|nr:50S ribosomal protein L10 [bacterium]MDB2576813.1 50S ribosomal protein L10 [Planctomycetota bacterium]MDB4559404.1 50S ribosomal protein L10 [Planctomycetota bacterium]MDB4736165.1 50S ribosomal protein L10 [Planctomycetota bacterium]